MQSMQVRKEEDGRPRDTDPKPVYSWSTPPSSLSPRVSFAGQELILALGLIKQSLQCLLLCRSPYTVLLLQPWKGVETILTPQMRKRSLAETVLPV